ncbi:DUF3040 domain-containing protein [Nakamurella antarctica]|uniref:DUF3040 domain-containing protein n=1 Tax=Nakamurella antarctica TaxID=1902245 RepID=A0A3G8ZJZ0_9ACTN|nr:DUF3040 domain-containing protein [Nakamurella antarctica]AZI57659.1 DUF3040 domain-containing protein [Nakamurella antarctica]
MPLSEHEQRMLDEIERALYEDDPKFANSVDEKRIRRRRPVIALIAFILGLVCLGAGVILAQGAPGFGIPLSVVGFLVMVGAVGLLVFGQPARSGVMQVEAPSRRTTSNLSDRMEERFRRRFDEQ